MKVIPLGTNGFFPSFGRQTACYIFRLKDTLIVLDAGSGLFRLAERNSLLQGVREVHLYLSHYHLDHTFGFYAAFKLLKGLEVKVFAGESRRLFSEFVNLNYFPIDYSRKHKNFTWHMLKESVFTDSGYTVSVIKQKHRSEVSFAYKFNFGLAYVTDGDISQKTLEFVKNIPLLLYEHSEDGREIYRRTKKIGSQMLDGHATTIGAALIAKGANVGQLALIHHNPFADNAKLQKQLSLAKSFFPKTSLAFDFQIIEF
jgi:ribonuclease BN (tRNA processing enzyme)